MAWEIQRILPRIQNVNKIIRKAEAAVHTRDHYRHSYILVLRRLREEGAFAYVGRAVCYLEVIATQLGTAHIS